MKTTLFLALREKLMYNLVEFAKPIYDRFFQDKKKSWSDITLDKLKNFPRKTLGKDLANFLGKEELDLMPTHETHDVYHVLLNYKTSVIEEARMQFFLMGNRKYSLFLIGANVLACIVFPEYIRSFFKEYQRGKNAMSIIKWKFEHLLEEPTQRLRNIIFKRPNEEEFIISF